MSIRKEQRWAASNSIKLLKFYISVLKPFSNKVVPCYVLTV